MFVYTTSMKELSALAPGKEGKRSCKLRNVGRESVLASNTHLTVVVKELNIRPLKELCYFGIKRKNLMIHESLNLRISYFPRLFSWNQLVAN